MNQSDHLKAYLDGELSQQEILVLERALVEDESLRNELQELRVLSVAVKAYSADFRPEGMEATLQKLHPARRRTWFQSGFLIKLGSVGAVVAGFAGLFFFLRSSPSSSDSAASSAAPVAMLSDKLSDSSSSRAKASTKGFDAEIAPLSADNKAPIRFEFQQKQIFTKGLGKAGINGDDRQEGGNDGPVKSQRKDSQKDRMEPIVRAKSQGVPSTSPPQTMVTIEVENLDQSIQAIRAIAGTYEVQGVMASRRVQDSQNRTLILDVPEGQSESVISKIKASLQARTFGADQEVGKAAFGAATSPSTGGFGGAGGLGGAKGSTGSAPHDVTAKVAEAKGSPSEQSITFAASSNETSNPALKSQPKSDTARQLSDQLRKPKTSTKAVTTENQKGGNVQPHIPKLAKEMPRTRILIVLSPKHKNL